MTDRIRFSEPKPADRRKILGSVVPTTGPYKGKSVAVFKRGCTGCFGMIGNDEVYIFYHELKSQVRRVR